jgi:hypothetical protein
LQQINCKNAYSHFSTNLRVLQTRALPIKDTNEPIERDMQHAKHLRHSSHACMPVLTKKTKVQIFTAVLHYFCKHQQYHNMLKIHPTDLFGTYWRTGLIAIQVKYPPPPQTNVYFYFFMTSKFVLQSVVIHLAERSVRLQWLGERHSAEPLRKYYVIGSSPGR